MSVLDMVWNYPREVLDILKHQRLNPELEPYSHGYHEEGQKHHETESFKVQLHDKPDIFLHWTWCQECKSIRTKRVIGYDESESIAYVREIVKNNELIPEAI